MKCWAICNRILHLDTFDATHAKCNQMDTNTNNMHTAAGVGMKGRVPADIFTAGPFNCKSPIFERQVYTHCSVPQPFRQVLHLLLFIPTACVAAFARPMISWR